MLKSESKKVIAIHQPNYIPWLGYFYKVYKVDSFIFLDDVQFSNKGMHNYHYIKTPQEPFRLKIPVNSNFGDQINQVTIRKELKWKEKHLKTIEANYCKTPYFKLVFSYFEEYLTSNETNLSLFNSTIIKDIARKLGIKTQFIFSSQLKTSSQKEEKIIDICTALKANVYLSGIGAKTYQNENNFLNHAIELKYLVFKPFEYPQPWGAFQSNVTIIDYLMNCGYDWNRVLEHQNKN